LDVSLIGRDSDIARLRGLVAESPVVFVYGAAGVGKTVLVKSALAGSAETSAIPDVVHISLEGVAEAREAVERSARAMGVARPARSGSEDDDLVRLFATKAATLVWDDLVLETSVKLAPLVARFASQRGPSRLVLVSRRFVNAKEVGLRAPVFEVKPLEGSAAVELVHAVEAARGRTLAEDVARATGGNPRLIQLALAGDVLGARIAGDATDVLRRTIEERMRGAQATVLALLSAAGVPLDVAEVARAAGKGGDAAIDELRRHLVVVREGARVSVAAPAIDLVRELVGDVPAATWKALAKIAARILAASPNDGAALLVAARAYVETGAPADALAVLKRHPLARASADLAGLERVLRAIAAESASQRLDALRLLAREQLRAGDYEAARRTLDDLPKPRTREDAERAALLRAECHVRAGEPEAAQRALDELAPRRGGALLGPAFALAQTQLAILRGELSEARALAERLAPQTASSPALEARRAVAMAASWLYEERYERTHEWVTHARAALRSAGMPLEPVVTILDVHSLLGLGLVERAEEVIEREARGRPSGPMLEVALLVRRGEARRALELGDVALAALGQRTDLLFRSVVARDLARAAMAIGDLGRAAKLLRLTEAGADEPGLAALRPICDAEDARLALARGDHGRAIEMIERAAAKIPSPFVEIDREVIRGRVPRAKDDAPAIVRAYAALRGAEGAIVTGALAEAVEMAESAAQFHLDSGLHHEAARAQLALAEALARLGLHSAPVERPAAKDKKRKGEAGENGVASASRDELLARAERAVDACVSIAMPRGYAMIVVGASLVRAAVCEARGDLDAATSAIGDALRAAGDKADASLLDAARRTGAISVVDLGARSVARGPWAPMIERLGLSRPADVVWRIGPRAWLRSATDPPPEKIACVVEVDTRRVRADDGRSLSLPQQRIALLCALAEAGAEGATLEELFARVWRGTFHPLRHRNTVYVALARLKDSLEPFAGYVTIAHDGERYRLAGDAPVAVRRRVELGR
jgi:tetratricopeptide (TPR) repeat protein